MPRLAKAGCSPRRATWACLPELLHHQPDTLKHQVVSSLDSVDTTRWVEDEREEEWSEDDREGEWGEGDQEGEWDEGDKEGEWGEVDREGEGGGGDANVRRSMVASCAMLE